MTFRFGVFNCRGLLSSPTKLDFLFSSLDLFVVTETKVSSSSQLPSNPSFERLDRPCLRRGTRGRSGGLAVFLRRGAQRSLGLWRLGVNHLWVRVDGVLPDGPLFVCAVYLPPGAANRHLDTAVFSTLEKDIQDAAALGTVLVAGDFNARTASLSDLDVAGLGLSLDDVSGDPLASPLLPPRRSPDSAPVDPRGRRLLSLCQATSLFIVNGRLPGNSASVPTSRGSRGDGLAVVDYILAPLSLLPLLASLDVHELPGDVSDHNLLDLTISLSHPALAPPSPAGRPRLLVPRSPAAQADVASALHLCLGHIRPPEPHSPVAVAASPDSDDSASALIRSLVSVLEAVQRPRAPPAASPSTDAPPWFSPALRRLSADTRRCAAKVRSLPADHARLPAAKEALRAARATYRAACRAAERRWKSTSAASFVGLAQSNPRKFWASIFRSAPVYPTATMTDLTTYFEQLLNPVTEPVDVDTVAPLAPAPASAESDSSPLSRLADPFTDAEVTRAVQALKTGRASDLFGLSAEVIKLLLPFTSSVLTPLFNRFLFTGFPRCLSTSVLIPIYKGKGDTSDPSNFRGISITPILSKLYARLLEHRLSSALDNAGLRADSQFGFRRHRGAREAAFVVRAVAESYSHRAHKPSPVYCAFVDFQKAFDSVQRPLLWRLLRNLGVPEPFVLALESYYQHVNFRVELPSGLGPSASASVGVKQGCPLSPVLFGVFIEALLRTFMSDTAGLDLPVLGRSLRRRLRPVAEDLPPVPPILYADDLTLIATSLAGLQRQLDRLASVAASFGLTINVAKTKLMAMGPTAPAPAQLPSLQLNDQTLEWVEEFKYLGLLVHYRRGFSRAASALHASALAKYYAMVRQCRAKGVEDADSLSLLFDSLVTSVLSYGVPIWGPDVFTPQPDANGVLPPLDDPKAGSVALDFERLQRRFMRLVLGLPQRTPHLVLQLETRRPPFAVQFAGQVFRFLHRLQDDQLFPPDSLVRRALAASADYSTQDTWLQRLHSWAKSVGVTFDLSTFIPPELSSSFSVVSGSSPLVTRTSAPSRARPLPPASRASASAYVRWVSHELFPRLTRDSTFRSHIPRLGPSFWSRRLPVFYRLHPAIRDRSLLVRSRFHLPIPGLPVFTSASTDLRALDPDPSFASDLTLFAHSLHFDPTRSLAALLADPPPSWPLFLRTLSRYFHLRSSHLPRSDILRLFPQLSA